MGQWVADDQRFYLAEACIDRHPGQKAPCMPAHEEVPQSIMFRRKLGLLASAGALISARHMIRPAASKGPCNLAVLDGGPAYLPWAWQSQARPPPLQGHARHALSGAHAEDRGGKGSGTCLAARAPA
eukprot:364189-Chlamydomonas_euryale.AAC.22